MDINKINENLDDFNIDELELSEDNLSEIEIQAMKKNIKAKVKKPRKKGKIVAASAAIVITGTMFTPVVAKNLPFISDIYKELGFFDGYEDYTKYIGESKNSNGYKVTIDNISTNGNNLLVALKVQSDEIINKKNLINCFAETSSILKIGTISSTANIMHMDEKTVVITKNINLSEINGASNNETIKLAVSMMDESSNNLMDVSFDLKVDLKTPLSKSKVVNVRKKLTDDVYIYSLKGTVKGANLKVKDKLIYDESNLEYRVEHKYYLNVDGVIHKVSQNNSSSFEDGVGSFNFPYLTADEIKKANSIELMVAEAKGFKEKDDFVEIIETTKGNLTYPSKIKTAGGLEGEFYNIEAHDNKIKLYFKSDFEALGALGNVTLWIGDEEKGIATENIGIIKKEDGNYIIEFNNVDLDKKSNVYTYTNNLDLDNVKIETMKIK